MAIAKNFNRVARRRLSSKVKGALHHGDRSAYAPHWEEDSEPIRRQPSLAVVRWLSRPDPDKMQLEASSCHRIGLIVEI